MLPPHRHLRRRFDIESQLWERIQSIFDATADLPPDTRDAALHNLCAGDQALADSVLALLEEDVKQQELLDTDGTEMLRQVADAALRPGSPHSLISRQIGSYRLLRLIGEGGMGIVYLAERIDSGGILAVKLLRDSWLSPMRRERFNSEQQTLFKLNHPSIARIYDAGTTDDGILWFAMEYVEGKPVTDYLRSRAATVRADLTVFRRVCEAVHYAHSLAIIHRDLKPSNILVTEKQEVKLLDFGIAKQMEEGGDSQDRTMTGLRLFTPRYAAPEQSEGGAVGVFTDIYSLGVILYEFLTGDLPASSKTPDDRLIEKPSAIVRRQGGLPGRRVLSKRQWAELDILCLTALHPEPQQRYRSVDAFVRDINAYLDGRVLEAKSASLSYSLAKFVGRNRVPLLSVTAALLLLAGATTAFTVRLTQARDAALLETQRTQRIQHFMEDMVGAADQEAAPANNLKVVTLLDREAQHASKLSGDPRTQLDLYQTVASMYSRLCKYDKALDLFSRAVTLAARLGPSQDLLRAGLLVQSAMVEGDLGQVQQGRRDIEKALPIFAAQHLPANDSTRIQLQVAEGRLELQAGSYQKAIDILLPISRMAPGTSGASPFDLRDSFSFLTTAQQSLQLYSLAEESVTRAIRLDKQLLGDSHPQTGSDICNLASIKASLGDFSEAERLYREGIGIMRAWYGADHPDVIMAFSLLARILIANKKQGEAKSLLQGILQAQETIYGPVHERVAFTLQTLSSLENQEGELASAEVHSARALSICRSIYGDDNIRTLSNSLDLGGIYFRESKYVLAEAALRRSAKSLPGNAMYSALSIGRWGRALLALKHYSEAEKQLTASEQIMKNMPHPPPEMTKVRHALAELYRATNKPEKAKFYETEIASTTAPAHLLQK